MSAIAVYAAAIWFFGNDGPSRSESEPVQASKLLRCHGYQRNLLNLEYPCAVFSTFHQRSWFQTERMGDWVAVRRNESPMLNSRGHLRCVALNGPGTYCGEEAVLEVRGS